MHKNMAIKRYCNKNIILSHRCAQVSFAQSELTQGTLQFFLILPWFFESLPWLT